MTNDDLTRTAPPPDAGETVSRPPDSPDTQPFLGSADSSEPPADPDAVPSFDHFRLLGELGRGGMGVVYRALDTHFMRDVAVKVLAERLVTNRTAVRRFLEEARVTGQLTHGTIPPVHQMGVLSDGRPFLAMKLIKGQTFDVLLRERSVPLADLTRHLDTLEQVCLGVGYAHSRGVIHRDLKPANVMVGAFGEVQVMDWGLAKEVSSRERERPEPATPPVAHAPGSPPSDASTAFPPPDATVLRDVRVEDEERTRAGTILGTPPYMSPEQASGDVAAVGPRSDVFSLGAVLCVILLGRPPYRATTTVAAVELARTWALGDTIPRLAQCKVDPAVVDLCKRCLAKNPADRPADGGAVADELARIRATAAERLRRADLSEMAGITRRVEGRKRKRVQLLLAAVVVLAVGLVSAGAWVVDRQARDRKAVTDAQDAARAAEEKTAREAEQAERERARRQAAEAVAEANAALARARTVGDDLVSWRAELLAAETAFAKAGVTNPELESHLAQASRDLELIETLDQIALKALEPLAGTYPRPEVAGVYRRAFARHGFDTACKPAEFAQKVKQHPAAEGVIAALLDWQFHAAPAERVSLDPLVAAAAPCSARFDKWVQARTNLHARENAFSVIGGTKEKLTGWLTERVAIDLWNAGDRRIFLLFLEDVLADRPNDFRLLTRVTYLLTTTHSPADYERAVRHATAAAALRPNSPAVLVLLADALAHTPEYGPVDALLKRAIKLAPQAEAPLAALMYHQCAYVFGYKGEKPAWEYVRKLLLDHPDSPAALWHVEYEVNNRRLNRTDLLVRLHLLAPVVRQSPGPLLRLAALYAALHDDQQAVKYYVAASAALPQSVEPLLGQAAVFARRATEGVTREERAEAAREAEAVLLKAEAMAPTDRGPHLLLVRLYIASGERNKLNARMRDAESRKGATSADDIVARVLWELDSGQLAEADKRILKFRQDRPIDPRGGELAALAAERKGNWDDAASKWQAAARILTNAQKKQIDREPTVISLPCDYSSQLANAYLKAKQFHWAVVACRDAVKEDPYSAFRQLRLAQMAVAVKLNWREVVVLFARAAELSAVPKDLPPLFEK